VAGVEICDARSEVAVVAAGAEALGEGREGERPRAEGGEG
jgi:hypothetical protein